MPAWPSIRGEDVGRSLAEMAQRLVDHHLALYRQDFQLLIGISYLLALVRRQLVHEFHALQGAFLLLRR